MLRPAQHPGVSSRPRSSRGSPGRPCRSPRAGSGRAVQRTESPSRLFHPRPKRPRVQTRPVAPPQSSGPPTTLLQSPGVKASLCGSSRHPPQTPDNPKGRAYDINLRPHATRARGSNRAPAIAPGVSSYVRRGVSAPETRGLADLHSTNSTLLRRSYLIIIKTMIRHWANNQPKTGVSSESHRESRNLNHGKHGTTRNKESQEKAIEGFQASFQQTAMVSSALFPCSSVLSVVKILPLNLKFHRPFSSMSDRRRKRGR